MMRALKIVALILPVLIPLLLAGKIAYERSTIDTYMVRIEGYDPRDLLYGHYLMFNFVPEKSAAKDRFPADIAERLEPLGREYYIPESKALVLEDLLRDRKRTMEIEVSLPEKGAAFMGDLYIDGLPMRDFLAQFEDRVDLDRHPEGQ